ncbi:MAG: M14 family metallopeptidase [Gemmatimonadetes bacterium]|nr:M14 family metallopeptidase [Gemmatimonadota bacterium]
MHPTRIGLLRVCLVAGLFIANAASAQTRLTSPRQQFGHDIGADYVLPNYTQFVAYWQKLAGESDRMALDTIGTTAEGRPQLMAIVTSPENHRNLERYRQIAQRLALAEGLDDEQARALAREGKAVVWIDGGLHATEVLGAQQLLETVWQLVSRTDAETMRILDDVIVLALHANPDGMELVSDWYMRNPDPQQRSTGGIPRLYQKYVGHDNNRDFYASTQPESENMNRVMYLEWFPQIMYNHHQTGPAGAVMFAPPFRDPPNYHFDPLIITGLDMVGGAMHERLVREGKGGSVRRSGASYSMWWNGGLRTTAYFHNIIGLLTETIGNPTPINIPFVPRYQLPSSDVPLPVEPGPWRFRQSIDYSVTANYAVLNIASRRKEDFLFNIYRMGVNAIEAGSRDSWTHYPRRVLAAQNAGRGGEAQGEQVGGGRGGARGGRPEFERALRAPAMRDARGYIIPSDQADFLTATRFVEALRETGVRVHRATSAFSVAGKSYPQGSYVVKTAQAFRAHVLDMFEPQDHPDDIPYPGGPPTPPYDNAGWTLAFQMAVQFDRVLDGFDGPFEVVEAVDLAPPAGRIAGSGNAGWLLSHQVNDAFVAVNRLLAANKEVRWTGASFEANGRSWPAGTFFIPSSGGVRPILERLATEKGLVFEATRSRPAGDAMRLRTARIGLVDRYGGSMPSGWTRWIFEQFEFPFEVVFPPALDAGNLRDKYDVLVFVDGMIPAAGGGGRGGGFGGGGPDPERIPEEYRDRLGNITASQTLPQLKSFMEAGGTVIAIGSSTSIASHLGLPVRDALVEMVDGRERELPREKYYIPGSVLGARVDAAHPLAHGIGDRVDFFFDNSPVFRLGPDADAAGIRRIAWFDTSTPLRSGWAWGQSVLENGVVGLEANVGRGKLFMFGPEITFRAQPHGTFKFLFNGIYYGSASAR